MVSNWWQKNIARLTVPSCCLCGLPIAKPQLFSSGQAFWCTSCRSAIVEPNRCQRCGAPTNQPTPHCGQCLRSPPLWSSLTCLNQYHPPLSQIIHQLKYQRSFWFARPLALELASQICSPAPLITCVPMHWRRRLWRGFNQSEHLAAFLSQHFATQFDPWLFRRCRHTPPQRGLTAKQRQRNMYSAFTLNSVPHHKHIAIADDVVTTGATVEQLCKLLLDVGVETIDIYCICRTTTGD